MPVLKIRDEKNKKWYEIGGASLHWLDVIDKPTLDDIPDGTNYGRIILSALSEGMALLSEVVGTLDDIIDGTYGKVLLTDISAGHILLASCEGDLDDIVNGAIYGRVAVTSISAGKILLAETEGDLDDIVNGTSYGRVAITDISAGHILLATCDGDLDDIVNGSTYGRVAVTDISAGHILLATCDGDLDDIANGPNYGKVALTSISAGKIIVAGLDSGVTARIFQDGTTKDNIEAWRKAENVTMIDGGKIYAKSITADEITAGTITAEEIKIAGITIDRLETGFIETFDGLDLGNIHGQGVYERFGTWVTTADASTSATISVLSGADRMLYLLDNSATGHVETVLTADAGHEMITGIIEAQFRMSNNSKQGYFTLYKGATANFGIRFWSDGQIRVFSNGAVPAIQAYSANTWYKIRLHFDGVSRYLVVFVDDVFKLRTPLYAGAESDYVDKIRIMTQDPDVIGFGINNLKIVNLTV